MGKRNQGLTPMFLPQELHGVMYISEIRKARQGKTLGLMMGKIKNTTNLVSWGRIYRSITNITIVAHIHN